MTKSEKSPNDEIRSSIFELRHPLGIRHSAFGIHHWILVVPCALIISHWSLGASPIQLRDVTRETGITFVHTDGSSGQRYIVETVASGLALFDYDNDGDVDIYFLNGAPLRGVLATRPAAPRNSLWRNDGNWKFTDVTDRSGLADTNYSLGVATADYDNDGDQDVYISNFGPNKLYRNNGDGTFTDVTRAAGVADGDRKIGAGVAFLDIDHDGDLDLFAAHYVDFTYENHRTVRFNGHPAYAGPLDYRPTPFSLFRNNGNGTFADISAESGVGKHKGAGMGVMCFDVESDGDTDIFVANDKTGNSLLLNDGKGNFKENAGLAGVAYDVAGRAQGSMGVECADIDNDGLLDLFVTTYQQELATLFRNAGKGLFDDATAQTRAGERTLRYVKWGVGVVDFDNDGHRDVLIASGHLHDNVHLFDNTTLYECPGVVLRNTGAKSGPMFINVSDKSGDGPLLKRSARGATFDDLDNDGDIDVVILNSRREPTILRNESARGNWLQVRLVGTRSNSDAIGARIRLFAGDLTLVDEVHSGRGYQSDYGRRLHFGLGTRDKIDRVEVQWPAGGKDVIAHPPANRLLTITETSTPD
ncbi:MAG: CRTAC1 family protein [Verrucomicrobia subdivision 3 bacterium]|nr:CRTAC1 family protein [Limisphaerales bacterium]